MRHFLSIGVEINDSLSELSDVRAGKWVKVYKSWITHWGKNTPVDASLGLFMKLSYHLETFSDIADTETLKVKSFLFMEKYYLFREEQIWN